MPRQIMYGPIQFSAIAFDDIDAIGDIISELYDVREMGTIRLVDFMFVAKDEDGDIMILEVSDYTDEERLEFGAVIGGLIGYGADGEEGAEVGAALGAQAVAENDFGILGADIDEVIEDLPRGMSACLVLFEHAWARKLKQAMVNHDGVLLAQGLIHPYALIGVGAELGEAVRAEEQREHEELLAEKAQSGKKGTSTKEMKKASAKKQPKVKKVTKK